MLFLFSCNSRPLALAVNRCASKNRLAACFLQGVCGVVGLLQVVALQGKNWLAGDKTRLFLAASSLVTNCALQRLAAWPSRLPGGDAGWAVARSALVVAIKANACLGMAMP
jgi:hypothetical protein